MKKKWLILLIIIAASFIYISASTLIINQESYRSLGWEVSKNDKSIINWEAAEVKLVNLNANEQKQLFFPDRSNIGAKFSHYLLVLNGNHAVYVKFNTTQDGLLGPIGLYFNPFTRVLIGWDIRM